MEVVTDPKQSKPHVVLLSSPGMGHLIPNLELGKQLVTLHSFQVTIFVVPSPTSTAETLTIESAMTGKLCEIVALPPIDISGLIGPKTAIFTQLCIMMREAKPAIRSAISGLKVKPDALIVDPFGTESLVVAKELRIPSYVYIATNAWFVALSIYVPVLDKEVEGEYLDQKEPLQIPGCMPLRPEDVVDPMLDRTDQQYFEYLRMGAEIPSGDGILVNTWEDLHPATLAALRSGKLLGRMVPVFPIGPLTRPAGPTGSSSELFAWLDKKPKESVIFVCLGSGGTLSFEQMTELAWGLELSQQMFIWVVRTPSVGTRDGSFFTTGASHDDPSSYLPNGFLERIHNFGLVVPEWAPQVNILSHSSVGGFLSHCGWNSTLESIKNGVPMIAWPLYAEQRMNAALLAEELGIVVRPKGSTLKEVVRREEIATMVRKIMVDEEGIKIRGRVKELKNSAEKALGEGGTSVNALFIMAKEIRDSVEASQNKSEILGSP